MLRVNSIQEMVMIMRQTWNAVSGVLVRVLIQKRGETVYRAGLYKRRGKNERENMGNMNGEKYGALKGQGRGRRKGTERE